jgi:hypothetical protein
MLLFESDSLKAVLYCWQGHSRNFVKIIAFEGMIRKILNMGAAYVKGLRNPPTCLFDTLFSCQCPFKI